MSSSVGGGGGVDDEEEQALQDRLAKREERRLRRLKEAQERQIDVPETVATDNSLEERASFRRGRSYEPEPDVEPEQAVKVEREEEEEEAVEQEEEPPANQVEDEEREEEVPREVEKPRRSYRHQVGLTYTHPYNAFDIIQSVTDTICSTYPIYVHCINTMHYTKAHALVFICTYRANNHSFSNFSFTNFQLSSLNSMFPIVSQLEV